MKNWAYRRERQVDFIVRIDRSTPSQENNRYHRRGKKKTRESSKGFSEGSEGTLQQKEKSILPWRARVWTC